jgi:hypothetical protein
VKKSSIEKDSSSEAGGDIGSIHFLPSSTVLTTVHTSSRKKGKMTDGSKFAMDFAVKKRSKKERKKIREILNYEIIFC